MAVDKITKCKQLIAENESGRHTPTISHYRDKENGMTNEQKKVIAIDKKINAIFSKIRKGQLPSEYFAANPKEKERFNKLETERKTIVRAFMQARKNPTTKTTVKRMTKTVVKSNPKLPVKSNSIYGEIIRDAKLKLNKLEAQLSNTPRSDAGKREKLATSIRALKDSIAFYQKSAKNPTAKKTVNPVSKSRQKQQFASFISNIKTVAQDVERFNKHYPIDIAIAYVADMHNISEAQTKAIYDKYKRNKRNPTTKTANSLKPVKAVNCLKRKNFTKADFAKHQTVRLDTLAKMFQGHANGLSLRVIEPDIAPAKKFRLGFLAQMKIKRNGQTIPIEFDNESLLSADLRKNLWVSGKDSILDNASLRALGIKKPVKNGLTILGDLTQIDYVTAKKHIENGETVRFFHKLGEADGVTPKLAIDYDGFPIIIGGGYDIWNVGIVN